MTDNALNTIQSIYGQSHIDIKINRDLDKVKNNTSFQSYVVYGGILRVETDFNRLRRLFKRNEIQ